MSASPLGTTGVLEPFVKIAGRALPDHGLPALVLKRPVKTGG
jgi:hypothetical protein